MTPQEIMDHPELAPLAILDTALDSTILSLAAAHPQLSETDPDYPDAQTAPPGDIAHCLVILARSLQEATESYRKALERERQRHWRRSGCTF